MRQWELFAEAVHRAKGQEAEGTENQRLCYNRQGSTPYDLLPSAKLYVLRFQSSPDSFAIWEAKCSNPDPMVV